MLIILSPAKIQNFKPQNIIEEYTVPAYLKQAEELVNELRSYAAVELEKLLSANTKIARHAVDSFYNWQLSHSPENAKQAVLVYNGEVYHGLDAPRLSAGDLQYAQKHLRLLSALYGVLRPLDLIQPYRLEMNAKMRNDKGNDLYAYWDNIIPEAILEAVEASGKPEVLLNLASNEYAKSVQFKKLNIPVIDFEFLEERSGEYKSITIYTKKARGLMTRYIIKNRIENIEELKGFNDENYWFNARLSTHTKMVFTRG